jgi:hypothetical protein
MPPAGHFALDISGHANPADFRSHAVDFARCRYPDVAGQRRAAFALASHPRHLFVDELFRDSIEGRIVLRRKSWPIPRISTTGAAGLTGAGRIESEGGSFHLQRFSPIRSSPIVVLLGSPIQLPARQSARLARRAPRLRQWRQTFAGYAADSWYPRQTP